MAPTNSQNLGFNYRGQAWSDGTPISRVPLPDNSEAEAQASLLYVWDSGTSSFVKVPGDAVNGIKVQASFSASVPTTLFPGKTTVTTAGTRVALASTQAIHSVAIKALGSNTGTIYVGGSTVAASNGLQLAPGDAVSLDIADLATVFIDSSVNGEGVTWLAS